MTRDDYRRRLAGRKCYVGLDLSLTTDLTAAVAVFPDDDGAGAFDVLAQFFVPKDRILARVTRDRVPYDEWARRGFLTATPGPTVDYDVVRAHLHDWRDEFDVRMLAFDPWNAVDLIKRLEHEDHFVCVKIRQTKAGLTAPSKAFEKAILEKTLRHDGHPILRWNVSNTAVEIDKAGNLQPSKAESTERIDGVLALIMGLDAMQRDTGTTPPAYDMLIVSGPS